MSKHVYEKWRLRYLRNRDAILEKARLRRRSAVGRTENRLRRRKHKEWIWSLKSKPCVDCGKEFHPAAMQFDHARGTKLFNIGSARISKARILAEIEKCDLVCANCHAVRTWSRYHAEEEEAEVKA